MFYLDKLVFEFLKSVGAIFGLGVGGGAFTVVLFFMYAYVVARGKNK